MNYALRTKANAAAFLALPLLVLALVTTDTTAQASRQVTAVERRIQTMEQQSKQYEMDNMGRDDKRPPVDAKRAREIKNEIAEDLNGLQSAYNEIVLALQNTGEPSELAVREQANGVRKKAERLKTNLVLPKSVEPEEKALEPPTGETRKKQMRTLATLIYDLITNPLFESTSGLDVKLARKASRDLDGLIAFSSSIGN